ncbi:MAG: alpha/beta fold hydrolase [Thermoleophilia bacterium]
MSVLHVHAFGPAGAPPVLVAHGVTNTGRRYRRLAEEHLPGLRVLAVDLRGHGASTWDPPWSVEQHVADLLDTLDDAGIDRLPVVGHSFGGLVGVHLAAAAPERVASLVLLDPAGAVDAARAAGNAEGARTDEGWATREEARAARLAMRPPQSRDTVDEDLDTFLDQGPDGRWRLRFSRPAVVTAWSEMARAAPSLAGYPGRVVLATALQDPYVTDAFRAALARDLGDRLEQVGIDAGHALFWDAPDEVGALVRAAAA